MPLSPKDQARQWFEASDGICCAQMRAWLASLPLQQRRVVLATFHPYGRRPQRRIAATLGVSERTVRYWLREALDKIASPEC